MHSVPSEVPPYLLYLISALLLGGALLLSVALSFVHQLMRELPEGVSRTWWRVLRCLILLFMVGYLGFFALVVDGIYTSSEVLVAAIFFLGAVFVLLVSRLALSTTQELTRVLVLEHEAMTDPLMGIYNRRFLDRRLQDEVLRAKRHKLDLMLLMVDLDRFKTVNDTWGHHAGDLVLQHVAKLLQDFLRQTDIVARYGGEEIVIILPHTPCPEGKMVAQRLRERVEDNPLLYQKGRDEGTIKLPVTISIGCACLHAADDTPQSLLARADQAMYHAKRQGRNRVICADQEAKDQPLAGEVA